MKSMYIQGLPLFTALFYIVLLASGCVNPADTPTVKTVTSDELTALMKSGNPYRLIDVRSQSEYEGTAAESYGGHIPTAQNIVHTVITDWADRKADAEAKAVFPDRGATIVLYCKAGSRARSAYDALVRLGYTNVRLLGGITSWSGKKVPGSSPGTLNDL